jgi:3-oxoacyl-[acyl-carrier-protein] synthase-3
MSRLLDFQDRSTCVLFGDGAGAVVLQATEEPGVLASQLHAEGQHMGILCAPGQLSKGQWRGDAFLRMQGQPVFKLAVEVLSSVAQEVLAKAGKTVQTLDWLITHQANARIIQAVAKRLNLPEEKTFVSVDQHGNTSAASVPLALDAAAREGKLKAGQNILLSAVGGGMAWGGILVNWTKN